MINKKVVEKHVKDAYVLAEKLYKKHYPVVDIELTNGKRQLGAVHYMRLPHLRNNKSMANEPIPFMLTISKRVPEKHLKEVCYHEVAHVVAGQHAGHGPQWKQVMKDFGYPDAGPFLNEKPSAPQKPKPSIPKPKRISKPKPVKKPRTNNVDMNWVRSFKGHPLKRLWYRITKWFTK